MAETETMVRCRYCDREIDFATNANGKLAPVEPDGSYHHCEQSPYEREKRRRRQEAYQRAYVRDNPGLAKAKREIEALDREMDTMIGGDDV